jgi:uncharacterized protein (DUF1778 family)
MVRPTFKDRATVRQHVVAVRVRAEQRKAWAAAAEKQGRTLSAWVCMMLDRAARTG